MKTLVSALLIILALNSCGQESMQTPKHSMDKFAQFKAKEKFVEDMTLLYPGVSDQSLQPQLNEKINQAADDFAEVAQGDNPTDQKYQDKIAIGLKRFDDIYDQLDTEDRERVCTYFEELMDIVELQSSGGHLNMFMYGFDPSK